MSGLLVTKLAHAAALIAAVAPHPHHHRAPPWRIAVASVYGEGDGSSGALACGGQLDMTTLGVANKTLPCNAKVRIRWHRRTVDARVRDRGPYVAGREFDLMPGTRRALGFPISVGAVQWRRGW